MNGINIAKVIISKRKEKGITQDDLADFIGVSKAAVSKWETSQTYPDIVLLPRLAAYFNISLDELMGYEPQMTDSDIRLLCKELANEFAAKPFDEVMTRCREIVNKYFSCFSLLYHIGVLYINYGWTSKIEEQKISTIKEARELFIRVKNESGDIDLKYQALHMEATCEMMLGNPVTIIELLKDVKMWGNPKDIVLLSQAYLMTGNTKEAKIELQRSIYKSILGLFDTIPPYLAISADNADHFEEINKRTVELIKIFNLKKLYPALLLPFYITSAQGYLTIDNPEKSLDMLEAYTDIAISNIYPLKLTEGDDFFNLLDESTEGAAFVPRDEKSIKQGMADAVIENPAFSVFSDNSRFKSLAKKLINNIRGN